MATITHIARRRDLSARRKITVELPEFLLCALEDRIAEANIDPDPDNIVTLEHVVELQLAEAISIGEVALLETKYPGITIAVTKWFADGREP